MPNCDISQVGCAGPICTKHLPAMASTRHVIKASDRAGGSSVNSLPTRKSTQTVNAPVVAAIMT